MNQAIMDFATMSDADLATKAPTVLNGMNTTPHYPGAASLVKDLQASYDIFSPALSVAKYGTPAQKAFKNEQKLVLVDILRQVCKYVNFATPGDRAKLLTTGLTVSENNREPVVLEPLKSFTVVNGADRGTVVAKARRGKGTKQLLIEYAVGPSINADTQWTNCPETKSSCVISGLAPASIVWVRATSIGSRGQKIHATPTSTVVL